MQFYYEDKNLYRILDEAEFWKRQESEHTTVIRQIVPNLEKNYARQLSEFKQTFDKTEGTLVQYIELLNRSKGFISYELEQRILRMIEIALRHSKHFIIFLDQLLTESEAVKDNRIAIVVINHIRRESEYFVGITESFLYADHHTNGY
ncbi:DUF2935 domain-containing protein [Haloplasma contractile]|uniref:Superoxide dismutase Fe-Mn family protein n=1 Tax=Haloplasma contractile SSD-17B TaxID=1033810 RepID=U2EAE5_9MOLU|nr:DUF2935 domain-containing protein [Haloplasma contractile]ERJ11806.1 superoxide dismutase Fe-Mn family protein [Haloplasma contractile SSD-17B]